MRLSQQTLAGLTVACAVALASCGPHRIPGTDIYDTPDTRAVIDTIETYRQASERRDAAAVIALVSTRYYDDAGTADPSDDIDYEQLKKRLADDYSKIVALKLDIQVRRVDVQDDKANAYIYYEQRYRILTKAGEIAKQASDQHRMVLVREQGVWKFLTGL